MIIELGHLALILALFAALAQASLPMFGAQRGWADFMRIGDQAALLQFGLLAVSFAALLNAFLTTDLSVKLVHDNSHSLKPWLYKLSGTWGNHEGSMLLWVLILALFGALISLLGANLPLPLKARTLAVQGMIGAAFIAFIIFTSNPFERLPTPPFEGEDLNPLLQDPGLAFHPPFLYLGYVGLSTSFAFAVAALIEGRVDAAWARWVRPWTLAAWIFLTIGIALGSYWAYYELGWGGWWFWDPVENASFMPWLAAAALLHSSIVVEKRGELMSWTILLAILAFSLSLVGAFIVRSGVLTSVHAFASDPSRGVFILLILGVAIGGSLWLFSTRAAPLSSGGLFRPISRESALLSNNILLAAACGMVFVGTIAPVVYDAFGRVITVGAPFFDKMFAGLMIPLLLILPIGAMTPWKRGDIGRVLGKLWGVALLAALALACVWSFQRGGGLLAPIGAGLGVWVVLGAFWDLGDRARIGRARPQESLRRLMNAPRADWGKTIAHAGLGLAVFGATMSSALERENVRLVSAGDRYDLAGYEFHFHGVVGSMGPNYRAEIGRVDVSRNGRRIASMTPEKRFFPSQRMSTNEVALRSSVIDDIYVVLGDQREDGRWALRSYVKPYVSWIWLGALAMAAGGALSLSDRRLRVGAPSRTSRARDAAPKTVAAE